MGRGVSCAAAVRWRSTHGDAAGGMRTDWPTGRRDYGV